MASRALARVRARPGRLRARLRPRAVARCSEPVILHWLGDMFDPALAGYWGSARRRRARWTTALGVIAAQRRPRSTASRSRCSTRTRRSRCAAACRAGVRMYTGDDFNYAELIAGDGGSGHSATRCSASSTRSRRRRARRWPRSPRATARASTRSSRRRCRCRATSSRRRRASTRPASSSWPGSTATRSISRWSAASRARASLLHLAELFRLADAAGLLERSRARGARACGRCSRCTASTAELSDARLLAADHRWLSINTATVRAQWRAAAPTSSTAARAAASARSRRGATRSRRPGSSDVARASATHGLELSGYCRGGMFPAPTPRPARRARRQPPRRRRGAGRSARPAWCWSSAACPARSHGTAGTRTSPARATRCATASRELLEYARARRHAARHRAAASDVRRRPRLRQHDGAGARPVRRARPGRTRRARRRASTSITSGGTRSCRRRSRAPARERLLAFHVCDWLVPTRDLLNDRGMMGDGVIDLPRIRALGRGRGLRGLQRGRDLLGRATGGSAIPTKY